MLQGQAFRTVDYDQNGYDYRRFWDGREYELWAEDHALSRLTPELSGSEWFADFGGGYGRNADHYLAGNQHAVLMDYSRTNLKNAACSRRDDVQQGRLFLIRCDLNKIPFRDNAFQAGMVVRVLHHLPDLPASVAEMARTIGSHWLVDVPIKHHLLGVARAAVHSRLKEVLDSEPLIAGTTQDHFWNFQLKSVRRHLLDAGFDTFVAASVNNLRRLDQVLPTATVRRMKGVIRGVELAGQHVGRGWWGPSQLLIASRHEPGSVTADPADGPSQDPPSRGLSDQVRRLAARMQCPECRGHLDWTDQSARCRSCRLSFEREGTFWNFVRS